MSTRNEKDHLYKWSFSFRVWPRLESNRDLELRRLLYYPLYYEAGLQIYLSSCLPSNYIFNYIEYSK